MKNPCAAQVAAEFFHRLKTDETEHLIASGDFLKMELAAYILAEAAREKTITLRQTILRIYLAARGHIYEETDL